MLNYGEQEHCEEVEKEEDEEGKKEEEEKEGIEEEEEKEEGEDLGPHFPFYPGNAGRCGVVELLID